jgi:hypothetical protein
MSSEPSDLLGNRVTALANASTLESKENSAVKEVGGRSPLDGSGALEPSVEVAAAGIPL